jgi:hypothetical protein
LTQAKSETQKILAKIEKDLDRREGWRGDKSNLITLERMQLSELRSVAAEISFQLGEDVGKVNTKNKAIEWIVDKSRWEKAKGIVHNWVEQQIDIDREREAEARRMLIMKS